MKKLNQCYFAYLFFSRGRLNNRFDGVISLDGRVLLWRENCKRLLIKSKKFAVNNLITWTDAGGEV